MRPVASWADVHSWHTTRGPYLYHEDASGAFLISTEAVPAGYLQATLDTAQRELGFEGPTLAGEAAARRLRAQWQHHYVAQGGALEVVVCFLTRGGRICLFKRSDRVDSLPGKWHTVSGYLPSGSDPLGHALRELREETGLQGQQVQLVAAGQAVTIGAPWRQLRWRIHPFAFEVQEGEPTLNWEHVDKAWVRPDEMRAYDCVFWLPDVYAGLASAAAR
jgi:8-oxo-dGTP pyrophosphatase MutT (NUDIX family)